MPSVGIPELLIILLIVIVIFGASKLPKLGKGLGEGIRLFKTGLKPNEESAEESAEEDEDRSE